MAIILSEKNKHIFDERVRFQDLGHKYWIDGDDKDIISSTGFIHKFFNDFDTEKVINNILKNPKYNDPYYKYYQMTFDEIKNQWDENSRASMEEGTKMHADIENFYNNLEVENDSSEFKQFLDFYEDHKDMEMYRTEWNIFSDILRLTGSIDATFINKDGTLSLGDWKRSKEISRESFGNKCGKFPLQHIQDCNYYHYSLQLNLYRVILEKFYGFKVKEMFLVIMHPKNKNEKYQRININKMDKEIEMMLDHRKEELLKKGYTEKDFENLTLNHTLEDAITGNPLLDEDEYEDIKPVKSFLRAKQKSSPEMPKKDETIRSFLRTKETFSPDIPKKDETILNKGKRWTSEEDENLMNKAREGINIEKISKIHKRTPSAVKMRLMQNLLDKYNGNINEIVEEFIQIPKEDLEIYKEKSYKSKEKRVKTLKRLYR